MKRALLIATALLICMTVTGTIFSAESESYATCEAGNTAYVYLTSVPLGASCPSAPPWQCTLGSFPAVTVFVRALALPFQKIQFSLPDPPTGTILSEEWFYPYTGDRVSGIELDLGDCSIAGEVCLGAIHMFATPSGCPPWQVDLGAQVQDCDELWKEARSLPNYMGCEGGLNCFQICPALPPHGLYPPDGATSVPLNVQLTWDSESWFYYCNVVISTDPACDTGQTYPIDCGTQSFSPNFLQPETTYYWRVAGFPDACNGGGLSPNHSFTTEGPVSTSTTTWGHVKAMYRD